MCNSLLTRCPGSQGALGAQQGYRQSNCSCDIEENNYVRPNCNLVCGAWEIWFGYGILLLNPYYQIDIYIYINKSNFRIQNAYICTVKINGVNHLLAAEPPRREAFTWIASKETLAQLPSCAEARREEVDRNKQRIRIYLNMDGYGWIYLDMDGYIWIWMDISGYGWIYLDMDGYISIWMDISGYGWIWMDMDG